ncbi:hypothetical protein [Corynebacterium alimapuense]|nr:hypothetical protein [Corynebacterium alimapuense]
MSSDVYTAVSSAFTSIFDQFGDFSTGILTVLVDLGGQFAGSVDNLFA